MNRNVCKVPFNQSICLIRCHGQMSPISCCRAIETDRTAYFLYEPISGAGSGLYAKRVISDCKMDNHVTVKSHYSQINRLLFVSHLLQFKVISLKPFSLSLKSIIIVWLYWVMLHYTAHVVLNMSCSYVSLNYLLTKLFCFVFCYTF